MSENIFLRKMLNSGRIYDYHNQPHQGSGPLWGFNKHVIGIVLLAYDYTVLLLKRERENPAFKG